MDGTLELQRPPGAVPDAYEGGGRAIRVHLVEVTVQYRHHQQRQYRRHHQLHRRFESQYGLRSNASRPAAYICLQHRV